jgi:serine/threonine protein kinase
MPKPSVRSCALARSRRPRDPLFAAIGAAIGDRHAADATLGPIGVIGIGSVVNGKYQLTRLLGDGGMGSVYEAEHAVLGTRVAIKVLHPELARRTGLVERFLQEARVAAQIRSVHVVHVTDVDRTPDGQAYIVMDLLEGEPLSSVLERQRKLPVTTACEYTVQILSALEAAHALGVIHRDLKPENVFVTFVGGKPVLKLIDFGIAKARAVDPLQQKKLTVAGVLMGTAEYMSPEQARSADRVDARADIYAAGVMLYEMIAGVRPVSGDDARIIALKVERGDVVPLVQVAPDVPREIAGLVHRAMAARPELRFATATEMRIAIEKANRSGAGTAMAGASAGMGQTAVGMRSNDTPIGDAPRMNTMRAPPIATAMAPHTYEGAALPAGPGAGAARRRRRSRGPILALVAVPVLVGAAVVGVLAATGTWASNATQPAQSPSPTPMNEHASSTVPATATVHGSPIDDVPKLVPTRPVPAPPVPHPTGSGHPTPRAAQDAGLAPQPFLLPSALPSTLPPFPNVLPPFPTNFPSSFPGMPGWPPMPSAAPVPTHVPTSNGPGY